jgi:ribose transport system substrate-binding protein
MRATVIAAAAAGALAASLAVAGAAGPASAQTVGPAGESPFPSRDIVVTDADAAKLRGKGHKAAMMWHESSDFVNAVTAGAKDEFARAGIEVVAETSANWDEAQLRSDAENVMTLGPDVILTLPFGAGAAETFSEARDAGVQIVSLSLPIPGYEHGNGLAAIVTDDLYQMGRLAADALAASMGGRGTVGWIYHDAEFYVTNQRDNAFKATIESDYPGISIVSEQGMSDPARAEEIVNAMLIRNPDLGGIYTPWAGPAEGALAALRSAGNKTTKIVTMDISEPLVIDMVKGGNVAAVVADEAYELGRAMAAAGMRGLLGKENPPFAVAPALAITADNVEAGYRNSLNSDAPASVMNAAQ